MTPGDLKQIAADAGVSAVLSLQHDECLVRWGIDYAVLRIQGDALGLRMTRRPMRDFDVPDQRRRLRYAVAALADLQARGHRTYVHCTAGLGRAPLTVLSFLVWIDGRTPEEAIGRIHRARPGAAPAWEAHHGCCEDLLAQHLPAIERRAQELHQARGGAPGDARADWLQAEREVLRGALLQLSEQADTEAQR